MKKIITFRKLLNILFYLTIILTITAFIGIIIAPWLIEIDTKKIRLMGENSVSIIDTTLYAVSLIVVFFYSFKALFYLIKVASALSEENYFSDIIIINLEKTGKNFLISGIINGSVEIIIFLYKFLHKNLSVSITEKTTMTLFLLIVGVFFIIQSECLAKAKELEEENKLTI